MTVGRHMRVAGIGLAVGLWWGVAAVAADGPPNPERRKPEVRANWARMDEKLRADIEKCEPYLYRKLNVYWTDRAPVIDGEMDDVCWKDADVAGGFVREINTHSPEWGYDKPTVFPTEVRVCYDAVNLYMAFRLHEPAMDKLALGQPPDWRDILDPNGNAVELFLDPAPGDNRPDRDADDGRYFHLAVNPRGATYDARGYGGMEWNPDWDVKTSLLKDGWIVEARLPFRCLNFPSEATVTPRTGAVWGALFCRNHAHPQEWSRWTSSGVIPASGFHNVRNYGRLAFMGRKAGAALPTVTPAGDNTGLTFGHNELAFTVRGEVTGGRRTLTRNGQEVGAVEIRPGGEIRMPIEIKEGGDLQVRIVLNDQTGPVYEFSMESRLPMARVTLDTVKRETADLLPRIEETTLPVAAGLRAKCEAFAREAARLEAIFDADKIDAAALDAFGKLHAEWRQFSFDAERIRAYPVGTAAQPFAAIPVDAYTKVFPSRIPSGASLQEVRLQAAGNDRESFQIMIVPFWTGLDRLEVSVEPLTDGTNAIAPADVEVFRMGYAQHEINYRKILPGYDPDDPQSNLNWPDLLLPVSNGVLKVSDGDLTTLWFDVPCPAGTPAGSYRGDIVLSANGITVTVPVALEAAGFDLPRHPTLRRTTWLTYHYRRVFHGGEFARKLDNVEEFLKIYERDLQFLEKYRLGQYPFGVEQWNLIKVWLEPDGRYTYDFSDLARVLALGRRYGANWYTASFHSGPGWPGLNLFSRGELPVTERATGRSLTLRECPDMRGRYGEDGWLAGQGPGMGDTMAPTYKTRAYQDFLRQWEVFLKHNGLLEDSYFELYDEQKPAGFVPGHRTLRQLAPDLPLMNEGTSPLDESFGMRGLGYADRWEPGLHHFDDPELLETLKTRRSRYGETYGFYVCGVMERADNYNPPYLKISQPSTAPRLLSWFAWKHDVDHVLYFMQFAGIPEKGWTPDQPPVSRFPGYSPLTYPTPDFTLLPTIRLASMRDGLEDYEYFRMLHDLTAYLDDRFPPHQELMRRVAVELAIEPEICKSSVEWTTDAAKLQAKRARLMERIAEVKAAIAAYPEDVTHRQ